MTAPARRIARLADLHGQVGAVWGPGDWLRVDQDRIDGFAAATDDHQWIHVDPQRAAAGPFGGTVAHGFLTLSLVPRLLESCFEIADSPMGINYGLNRVRFPAPVPVGSRLRAGVRLQRFEPLPAPGPRGALLTLEVTVVAEGQAKPVCVAELLVRRHAEESADERAADR